MPRTKQPRRVKSTDGIDEGNRLLKDFEKNVELRLHKMQVELEGKLQSIESRYTFAIARFPQSVAKLTLREILNIGQKISEEDNICEVSSSVNDETISPAPKTVKAKRNSKRTTTASDDGYMTEAGTTTSTTQNSLAVATTSSKSRKIRTRSSSVNRTKKLSEIVPTNTAKKEQKAIATSMKYKFKTPALLKHHQHLNEYGPVTPKCKPNTPLSVMRRPRQGEMALSMQGSPLLVTSVVNENMANVNVPLENGRVLSLLPNDGLRLSYLPEFDAETRRQLVTLKQHLDKVIGS